MVKVGLFATNNAFVFQQALVNEVAFITRQQLIAISNRNIKLKDKIDNILNKLICVTYSISVLSARLISLPDVIFEYLL